MSEESKVLTPGIYPDLTNEQYHDSNGISKSGICKILRSPRHYYAAYLDPERKKFEETEAMKIGSAAHKLILEGEDFFDDYAIIPESISSLTGKGSRTAKPAYTDNLAAEGKIVLKKTQMEACDGMAKRVMEHPEAGSMLVGGVAEQSIYWIDEDTGVLAKCRPDYLIPEIAIPDLKTTNDARPDKFAKSCGEYEYHIQAAFYSDGVMAATGFQLDMPFIAVEKDSPFELNVFWISPDDVNLGRTQYKRALEIYARCLENDDWPGYSPQVKTISLPPWFRK